MAQYDRNDRNSDSNNFGRRSDNRYDRYATERGSYNDRSTDRSNPAYNDRSQYQSTGDWRDDESRSRGENRNDDRGFFERAADEVTSWFSSDDNDRDRYRSTADRDREEYYARRYNTEGARGAAGRERDYNSTFDTRYGQNLEEDRLSHTNQDDNWRTGRDNTASWSSADSTRYENRFENRTPDRFSRDQADGREAGRDYHNRLNQDLRSGSRDQYSNQSSQSQRSPYAQSNYGSYGRSGSTNSGSTSSDSSRYGSSNYSGSTYGNSGSGYNSGSSYNSGSNWSNQSGTYGDNSGSYGSSSRGQHTGKGPKGWRRSDDRVKEDVCEYLERSASIDASDIDVTVAEGVVTLTGTVSDRSMKRMCEDEIENLPGVKDVNNQLRVNRDSSSSDSSSRSASSVNSSGSSFGTSNGTSSNGSTMGSDGASNTGMSASSNGNNTTSTSTSRTDNSSSTGSKKSGSSVS